MQAIEIIVIIVSLIIIVAVFGNLIYRKIKHKPTGECACCQARMQKMIKKMRREANK